MGTLSETVNMETWKLALRSLQLVLVIIVFLLARFGLGFRILQYGYVVGEFPEPSSALLIGDGWDKWWLATGLAHYILILPVIMMTETLEPGTRIVRNLLMTITGAVFLLHVLIETCLMIGSVGEEIVIDTRLPLYRPKTCPKRGTQGVFSVDVLRGRHGDQNQQMYLGQTVKEDFKPT